MLGYPALVLCTVCSCLGFQLYSLTGCSLFPALFQLCQGLWGVGLKLFMHTFVALAFVAGVPRKSPGLTAPSPTAALARYPGYVDPQALLFISYMNLRFDFL